MKMKLLFPQLQRPRCGFSANAEGVSGDGKET